MVDRVNKAIAMTLVWASSLGLQAEPWVLDNEGSHLSFVTVKAGDLAEAHRFRTLTGKVSINGTAEISIDLASVDTLIPIRDERMREHLFQTVRFPQAIVALKFDPVEVESIAEGASGTVELAMNRVVSQAFPPIFSSNLTAQHCTNGPVHIDDR